LEFIRRWFLERAGTRLALLALSALKGFYLRSRA